MELGIRSRRVAQPACEIEPDIAAGADRAAAVLSGDAHQLHLAPLRRSADRLGCLRVEHLGAHDAGAEDRAAGRGQRRGAGRVVDQAIDEEIAPEQAGVADLDIGAGDRVQDAESQRHMRRLDIHRRRRIGVGDLDVADMQVTGRAVDDAQRVDAVLDVDGAARTGHRAIAVGLEERRARGRGVDDRVDRDGVGADRGRDVHVLLDAAAFVDDQLGIRAAAELEVGVPEDVARRVEAAVRRRVLAAELDRAENPQVDGGDVGVDADRVVGCSLQCLDCEAITVGRTAAGLDHRAGVGVHLRRAVHVVGRIGSGIAVEALGIGIGDAAQAHALMAGAERDRVRQHQRSAVQHDIGGVVDVEDCVCMGGGNQRRGVGLGARTAKHRRDHGAEVRRRRRQAAAIGGAGRAGDVDGCLGGGIGAEAA